MVLIANARGTLATWLCFHKPDRPSAYAGRSIYAQLALMLSQPAHISASAYHCLLALQVSLHSAGGRALGAHAALGLNAANMFCFVELSKFDHSLSLIAIRVDKIIYSISL